MEYQRLNPDNDYIKYLKIAVAKEPELILTKKVDEKVIEGGKNPFFINTRFISVLDNSKKAGWISYCLFKPGVCVI